MQQQYLRTNEAASYIRKSKSWLDQARCRGAGPDYIKTDGLILYRVSDIERWFDERVVRTGTRRREIAHVAA